MMNAWRSMGFSKCLIAGLYDFESHALYVYGPLYGLSQLLLSPMNLVLWFQPHFTAMALPLSLGGLKRALLGTY